MTMNKQKIIERAEAAGMNPKVVLDRMDCGWPLKDALLPFEAFAKPLAELKKPKQPLPKPKFISGGQNFACERCGGMFGMGGESALIGWCEPCYWDWCNPV